MMGKVAFLFPGQGSQTVGMGQSLAKSEQVVADVFQRADKRLDFPLSTLIAEGPADTLTVTYHAQPALLTTSIAILAYFKQFGIKPDYVAGHSLGEYTALVAAGAISFEDAVYAVRSRGQLMEAAVPNGEGAMAAIMGLERQLLEEITATITNNGDSVQLANLNCPGQIVISGTKAGVEKASEVAKSEGARRAIPLNVSGPFHSQLMELATAELKTVLDGIVIENAKIPIVANVDALPVTASEKIKENLLKQLSAPVLWEDSIRTMLDRGVDTFIEVGPGRVLSGLVRKIERSAKVYAIQDEETCVRAVKAIKEG